MGKFACMRAICAPLRRLNTSPSAEAESAGTGDWRAEDAEEEGGDAEGDDASGEAEGVR